MSARNAAGRQAIFAFKARGFLPGEGDEPKQLDLANVQQLDWQQVKDNCDRLQQVQKMTDAAVKSVRDSAGSAMMSAQQFGTAVHLAVKQEVGLENPDFVAEKSYLKSAAADNDKTNYGTKNSVRIDVLEYNRTNNTVCVYDIKTGQAGLSLPRMIEIAQEAFKAFKRKTPIIVTEVRPSVY
jgi:hypothetical protein